MRATTFVWGVIIATAMAAGVGCGDDSTPISDAGPSDTGRDDAGDPCEGIVQCAAVGASCAGNTLVTCTANTNGCLVETQTNCETSGSLCDDSGSTPMCIFDACAGVADHCTTAGRTCDGETLVVCTMDVGGCLFETRTPCGATAGASCDETVDPVACVITPDPCDGLAGACDTAGTRCDGMTLVTCAPNAFGCLVETRTDCTTRTGTVCLDTAPPPRCLVASDPCVGITECVAGTPTACVGDDLVRCVPDGFSCRIETSTDCTATDRGSCGDVDGTPICAVAVDRCMGATECPTEGRSCVGDTLHVCAPNAFGCLLDTATDCTATGQVCDDSADTIRCVDAP